MTLALAPIAAAELAARIAIRYDGGDWLALVVPGPEDVPEAARQLEHELADSAGLPVEHLEAPGDADEFIRRFRAAGEGVLLILGAEAVPDAAWRHLDLRRSDLARSCCVVVITTREALARILTEAPNLSSWISGSLWRWDRHGDEPTAEDIEQRLQALRERFGQTDAEVIRLAEQKSLPREPEYGEWLVLLGRGDAL